MNRRNFIRGAGLAAAAAACPLSLGAAWGQDPAPPVQRPAGPTDADRFVRPAMFYKDLGGGLIRCQLCPRGCRVEPGQRGRCRVRENRGGQYHTLVYGRAVALNNDPIEKKPFYHVMPGQMVLSVATAGCNLSCKFCQNWQIAQFPPEEVAARALWPDQLVALAKNEGIPCLAFTYNEPTVTYEYMYDTMRRAHEAGVKPVVVSNGFISGAAVRKLAPHLAAYKVDLKAFTQEFYRDYCSGRLTPVLDTLETLVSLGVWVEIVNLVLPTANDDEKDVRAMAAWIKAHLGPMVPIHFTRFHPMYKIRNLPPTPVSTLKRCYDAAKAEGLRYPYIGNVAGLPEENTHCHHCGRLVIKRTGLWSVDPELEAGACPDCGTRLPGVWA